MTGAGLAKKYVIYGVKTALMTLMSMRRARTNDTFFITQRIMAVS